jgi:hypothetical protein
MENIEGPSLGEVLEQSDELLDLDTVASILDGVVQALECAHENQVLHLDIKPDNILFDHNGQTKVTDFGLSELSGTAGFSEPQGGTIGYMPPEQLTQGKVDERTDLWALAILLYQLLTGKNPFLAKTTAESLDRIRTVGLPLPSALREGLDPAFDEILITGLLADKNQRFASVQEFLHAMSPYLGNVPKGRRKLKYLVNSHDLDEIEFGDDWHQPDPIVEDEEDDLISTSVPLWDRLPTPLRGAFVRLVAALACGSLAFVGLTGFGLLQQTDLQFIVFIGVVALVALAGFIVPQLGGALAAIALIAGVIARGGLVAGLVLALVLVIWWLLLGRQGRAETILVALTPLLGALWMPFALPLLAGYFLPWKRALCTALVQGLLLIALVPLANSAGLAHTGLLLVVQPGILASELVAYVATAMPWITVLSFVVSALVMSLVAGRQTRWSGAAGSVLGLVLLTIGCAVVPLLIEPATNLMNLADTGVALTLSFILVLVLSTLGVPTGTEEQERRN